jgi:hypothetical protein
MIKVISKRDLLKEALGVPNNLPKTAKEIYYAIIRNISPSYDFEKLNGLNIIIDGNYRIGDYIFDKFNFRLNIELSNEFNLLSMGSGSYLEMNKDIKNNVGKIGNVRNRYFQTGHDLRKINPYGFDLSITFNGPYELRGEHILKYFLIDRDNIIKIIGHELMHLYDFHKNRRKDLGKQVESILSQEDLGFDIPTLNTFKAILYFVNANENIVRMSEIGTSVVNGDITKKDFENFLSKDSTVQTLRFIKDYNFSEFKNELISDKITIIKILLTNNLITYDFALDLGLNNNKFLEIAMDFFQKIIIDAEINIFNSLLNSSNYTDDEKKEVLARHKREIFKKGKNSQEYFEKTIKSFNFEAEKVLRKIFKLYAMAKNTDDKKLPSAMKRMKTESKWINMDYWDKFIKSQKNKGNMQSKDGITKRYIY